MHLHFCRFSLLNSPFLLPIQFHPNFSMSASTSSFFFLYNPPPPLSFCVLISVSSILKSRSITLLIHPFEHPPFPPLILDEENDSYNNPKPLHLSLVDFSGLCTLSIPSRWIDLDKPVTCKVSFRDYTVPVVSMHLLLIRTEYIHDVSTDSKISQYSQLSLSITRCIFFFF